ncbi:MAG: hypothetical protein KDK70_33455, partial [Myxococcales bacterium]|nr:hypothetical protein [Myxococcales bacterium]
MVEPAESSAQRIAAAARALGPALGEHLTLHADALVDALERQLELAAWDREQLVGQVQLRVAELHRARPSVRPGPPVRVIERRSQPLEAIDTAWSWLRRGRAVRLELEAGACTAVADLLQGLVPRLPAGGLELGPEVSDPLPAGYVEGGVDLPGPRIAVIDADADRELAAYVLARTGLRRSGMDPRGVKRVYVAGELELLERHMRRLWVGVSVGPVADPRSFAGPVSSLGRDRFLAAHERWRHHPDVRVWCPGGVLERTGDPACYLAPALFVVSWPIPELPLAGPMVAVVACAGDAQLREAAREAQQQHGQVVQIGGRPGRFPGDVRHVRGALLVERLPPGLPEP